MWKGCITYIVGYTNISNLFESYLSLWPGFTNGDIFSSHFSHKNRIDFFPKCLVMKSTVCVWEEDKWRMEKPNLLKMYGNYCIKSVQELIYAITYLPGCSVAPEMQLPGLLCKQHRMRKFSSWGWELRILQMFCHIEIFSICDFCMKRLFGQSIPCIQGLNTSKVFDQSTHKKTCFLCSLTWPDFKCLKIAANHIQLSTSNTVYFCLKIFNDTIFDPFITSGKKKRPLRRYKHWVNVLQGWPKGTMIKAYLSSFRHET